MSKNVLVMISCDKKHQDYLLQMAGEGADAPVLTFEEHPTEEEFARADAIIGTPDPEDVRNARRLEWLQSAFAGADAYVKDGVLPEKTILCNASGAYGPSVSEHMVAMTFALNRRLREYLRNQVQHVWQEMGKIRPVEGSTVLVLGLGDIGGMYAAKMKALGCHVIGIRRTQKPKPDFVDEQYTMDHLDEVLPRADYVAMILPGGEATRHVMDARRLRLMKPGAFLINDGRGSAVDPKALKEVLADGHLGGAALDVTEPEPLPAEDPLWDFPNVIITPHVAGKFLMEETYERVVRIAGTNLAHYAKGEPLEHVVDKKAGY